MNKWNTEFKVGLFTLLGFIAIAYLFISLNPDMFKRKKMVHYYTYLEDAAGIVPKTHVKTNGVSIGKVEEVKLEADKTRILMLVDAKIKIPVGSTLEVRSVGLLGDSHIEIIRSKDTGEYLKPGDYIPKSPKATDIRSLISSGSQIAYDIKEITENFRKALGGQEGYEKIEEIITSLKHTIKNAEYIVSENRENIKELIDKAKEVAQSLRDITNGENKEKIQRIIASIDESMLEVREASKNIKLISQKIEKGEGTLGKLVNKDDTITELEATLKEVKELLSSASRLQIGIESHVEARRDDSSQTYFNLKFMTRPDRYYLIGFTDLKEDEITERVKHNTDEEGNADDKYDSSTTTKIEKKHALRFNLQLAKRWYFIALRFGIFESTGGVGADAYFWKDRIRLSLEAFDWQTKDSDIRKTAHFKAYATILFFNHIYLLAGIDDISKYKSSKDKTRFQKANIYGGAGITFTDQDLKTLFGAAALKSAF